MNFIRVKKILRDLKINLTSPNASLLHTKILLNSFIAFFHSYTQVHMVIMHVNLMYKLVANFKPKEIIEFAMTHVFYSPVLKMYKNLCI